MNLALETLPSACLSAVSPLAASGADWRREATERLTDPANEPKDLRALALSFLATTGEDPELKTLPFCAVDRYESPPSLVRESNVEAIREENPWPILRALDLVSISSDSIDAVPSDHEGYVAAVAILADLSADDVASAVSEYGELNDTRSALEDYPLFDEEHHSALEMERQNEAWTEGAGDDLARAIVRALGIPDDDDAIAEALVNLDDWGPQYAAPEAWADESTFLSEREALSRLGLGGSEVCPDSMGIDPHIVDLVAEAIESAYPEADASESPGPYLDDEARATLARAAERGYACDTRDVARAAAIVPGSERIRTVTIPGARLAFRFASVDCRYLPRTARVSVTEAPPCDRCDKPSEELIDSPETFCDSCLPDMGDVLASYRAWNDPWISKHEDDAIALREAYNDHLDRLQREGEISPRQLHYARNPY